MLQDVTSRAADFAACVRGDGGESEFHSVGWGVPCAITTGSFLMRLAAFVPYCLILGLGVTARWFHREAHCVSL